MAGAYDDRDGVIWMDGELVNWRDAKVHILTHGLHYGSSVFEGERAYNGKIFKRGPRRVKRFECIEISTGKVYLFNPNAEVELL